MSDLREIASWSMVGDSNHQDVSVFSRVGRRHDFQARCFRFRALLLLESGKPTID